MFGMFDIAAAVLLGNLLTACVIGAFIQFKKHDEDASWLAYAGFLLPMAFLLISILLTEGMPPQFDGLALR